ncbi:MAG: endonuclease/exonuclease/phosphatase family protein [Phycisphaerae bacterium]
MTRERAAAGQKRAIALPAATLLVLVLSLYAAAPQAEQKPGPSRATSQPADAAATRPADGSPRRCLRIATFNVLFRNIDLKAMTATAADANADILCLQETTPRSVSALKKRLGERYPHVKYRHGVLASGFAVFSRLPLEKVWYVKGRTAVFRTMMIDLKLDGRDVRIANVHLCPTLPRPRSNANQLLALLQRTEDRRLREIKFIHGKLPTDRPTLIVGDMNTISTLPAGRYLTDRGYVDSYATASLLPDLGSTIRFRVGGVNVGLRIDYVLHTRDFRTLRSRILPSDGSDHSLVVSDLAWRKRRATTRPAER